MDTPIFNASVDRLATLLEEGARASAGSVKRFIEPMPGTLRRAEARRHHLVFGRRGSGKSSLLLKTVDSLSREGIPVAYVDLEPFKGHHYPDVLISVLLAALMKFSSWLSGQEVHEGRRTWKKLWIRREESTESRLKGELECLLSATQNTLRNELYLTDKADLVEKNAVGTEASSSADFKAAAKVRNSGGVEAQVASQAKVSERSEVSEEHKRSKIDLLHRSIIEYHHIFDLLSQLTGKDCFLFLDDLYHIARADQPQLLDYFHRIAKGHSLWLKVGTIKHRSKWYVHSPQPLGLKLGDDADEINLDLTLEKFSTSRRFLSEIAETYIAESESSALGGLVSDGGLDRLVIASGGVARDFLGIFRRSIDETRERLTRNPRHARGGKIGAEDVNMATGNYGDTKREEFQKDTLEDQQRLDEAFTKIRVFCLEKANANVFLIDQETNSDDYDLVQELIDLRLVHHVRSRVTVSARPGRVYRALLLDVSQYTGERKRRNLDMLEFWKEDREILRRASLIYDPGLGLEELREQIDRSHVTPVSEETSQLKLELGLDEEDGQA